MIDIPAYNGVYFQCFKNQSPKDTSPHVIKEGVIRTMRIMQGVFLLSVCLLIIFGACRRNQPSLVDRNQPPDTQLWYAPPDSSEYQYLVHIYWRGVDYDGTATRFIWVIRDTLVEGEDVWNPAARLRDYRAGTITSKTDSVFSFTAFVDAGGVGQVKNRQAFHVAAIDDDGVIDPSPAAIEFVATIDELPRIQFSTHIQGVSRPYYYVRDPVDTVGMFKPFAMSYHGSTINGNIRAYKYFPISTTVTLPGSNIWNYDLSDTMRVFPNSGDDVIPSGVFKFAAQCLDDANAESPISPATFVNGVCRVVVNFDPDTRIHEVRSLYSVGANRYEKQIDFADGIPDTVSYQSWITLFYSGWDDPADSLVCNPLDPDRCLDYQFRYLVRRVGPDINFREDSRWLPRDGIHDTDSLAVADSNSVSIGSLDYEFLVRAIDENARGDGTPPSVEIVGNFVPTLDSVGIEDHLGNRIDVSKLDTLTWNFWKGEGWPYTCWCDTVDLGSAGFCADHPCPPGTGSFDYFKTFSMRLRAWGHDHPLEPAGSGVKAWQYQIYNSQGELLNLAGSGGGWVNSSATNQLNEVISRRFDYNGPFTQPPGVPDPMGDSVFAHLPDWFDDDLTVYVWGRDTLARGLEGTYEQVVFLNGERFVANAFAGGSLGRLTETKSFTFHVRLIRP